MVIPAGQAVRNEAGPPETAEVVYWKSSDQAATLVGRPVQVELWEKSYVRASPGGEGAAGGGGGDVERAVPGVDETAGCDADKGTGNEVRPIVPASIPEVPAILPPGCGAADGVHDDGAVQFTSGRSASSATTLAATTVHDSNASTVFQVMSILLDWCLLHHADPQVLLEARASAGAFPTSLRQSFSRLSSPLLATQM